MNSPRCKCSHARSLHYRDRKGRPTCGIAACGCARFREDSPEAAQRRHPSGKETSA